MHLVFVNRNYVNLHTEQGSGSDHKWSLEMHLETHSNGGCELLYQTCPLVRLPTTHVNVCVNRAPYSFYQ